MRYRSRISSLLLIFSLLCMISANVCAQGVPDGNRKGTVTVEMEYDGRAVAGGILTAYRVGQIKEEDGNWFFEKTDAMTAFGGSYEDIGSAELAEKAAAFVEKHQLPAYGTAKNRNGKAVFSGLELGLYLVVQTEASEGYEPLKPFLVSVPMSEDGGYVYEVNAEGKFELHRESESPEHPSHTQTDSTPSSRTPSSPAKPSEPFLPQTGQLNWPIPVLAALGMCLFSVGWMLRFGRRKDGYEK